MTQKKDWLPIDDRLIPDIFSFKYPKSIWVKGLLVFEMALSVLAVIGTLILVLLPRTSTTPKESSAATTIEASPSSIPK
jgi:hypothetical protein